MNRTNCYSYFTVNSKQDAHFVSRLEHSFDPEYITARLGIEPFDSWRTGDIRHNRAVTFSKWSSCKQTRPIYVDDQCLNIVRVLKDKIPVLVELRDELELNYCISIVPSICHAENLSIGFDSEVIAFCYLTGTEIAVYQYIFDGHDAKFESVDELSSFGFQGARISDISITNRGMIWDVSSLIVTSSNSQNDTGRDMRIKKAFIYFENNSLDKLELLAHASCDSGTTVEAVIAAPEEYYNIFSKAFVSDCEIAAVDGPVGVNGDWYRAGITIDGGASVGVFSLSFHFSSLTVAWDEYEDCDAKLV